MSRCESGTSGNHVLLDLHPLHYEASERLEAEPLKGLAKQLTVNKKDASLKLPARAALARDTAALAARTLAVEENLNLAPAFRIFFDLEGRCLHVHPNGDGPDPEEVPPQCSTQVPLLQAEVAHSASRPDRHILSIIPYSGSSDEEGNDKCEDPGVWLITMEGDEAMLLSVLDTMSFLGAIRTGLAESFVLSTKELGSGGCATVYLAHSRGGVSGQRTPTAIKLAREPASKADKALMREMPLVVAAQGHGNIVRFLGIFRAPDALFRGSIQWALALELCRGGDLQELVAANGPQNEAVAASIMSGVLAAIAHIHDNGVVHRDVKSENILMAEGGRPVLTDFGVAAFLSDEAAMATRCGSAGYVAPEVLKADRKYDSKVDVFGVGVTLYFILSATLPFQGQGIAQVLRRNLRCKISLEICPQFRQVDMWAKNFLLLLLAADPEDRPTAAAALMHTWLMSHQGKQTRISVPMKHSAAPPPLAAPKMTTGKPEFDDDADQVPERKTCPGGMGRRRQQGAAPASPPAPAPPPKAEKPSAQPRRWRQVRASDPGDSQEAPASLASTPNNASSSYDKGGMALRPAAAEDEERMVIGDLLDESQPPEAPHAAPKRGQNRHPTAPARPPPERGPAPGRRFREQQPQKGQQQPAQAGGNAPAPAAPNFEMQMQPNNEGGISVHRRWRLLGAGNGAEGNAAEGNVDDFEDRDTSRRSDWETMGNFSVAGSGLNTPRTSWRGSFNHNRGGSFRGNGTDRGSFDRQPSRDSEQGGSFLSRISFGSNRNGNAGSAEPDRSSKGSFRRRGGRDTAPIAQRIADRLGDGDEPEERASFGETGGVLRLSSTGSVGSSHRGDDDPLAEGERSGLRSNLVKLRQKYAAGGQQQPPSPQAASSAHPAAAPPSVGAAAPPSAPPGFDPHGDAMFEDALPDERSRQASAAAAQESPAGEKAGPPMDSAALHHRGSPSKREDASSATTAATATGGGTGGASSCSRNLTGDSIGGASGTQAPMSRRHTNGEKRDNSKASGSGSAYMQADDDDGPNVEHYFSDPSGASNQGIREHDDQNARPTSSTGGGGTWLGSRSRKNKSTSSKEGTPLIDKSNGKGTPLIDKSNGKGMLPVAGSTSKAAAQAAVACAEACGTGNNGKDMSTSRDSDVSERASEPRPNRTLRNRLGSFVKGLGR